MKMLRLTTMWVLLFAAAQLLAQGRYIYAEPVYMEAGQEAELVVKMDYDAYVVDVAYWQFKMQLPDGVAFATPDNPIESCTLSREMYDSPHADDELWNLRVSSSNQSAFFEFRTDQNGFGPVTFAPMISTHCEILRIAIKSDVTQTVNPEITGVNINDTHFHSLVLNGVDQCPEYSNTLYVKNTDAFLGSDFILPVKMYNSIAAEGFAFDLILPSGMNFVTDEDGNFMISLSEERNAAKSMNTFSAVKLHNYATDAVRVIAASSTGASIAPGNGEVCRVKVRVGTGMKEGRYQVTMRNVSVADNKAVSHDVEQMQAIIAVKPLALGDANGDGKVTVADLTAIAHHVLGNTPKGFSATVADANQDGLVNVADYTAVAHLLLYGTIEAPGNARIEEAGPMPARVATDIAQLDDVVYIAPAKAVAGEETVLSVRMKNSVDAEGFQFTLGLPEGVTVVSDADGFAEVSLSTERTTATRTNTFASSLQPNGSLIVMAASTNGSRISAGDGEVCTVKVRVGSGMAEGDYALLLRDVAISDANAHSHNVGLVESTLTIGDVSSVTTVTTPGGGSDCFDIQGRRTTATNAGKGVVIRDGKKYVRQ